MTRLPIMLAVMFAATPSLAAPARQTVQEPPPLLANCTDIDPGLVVYVPAPKRAEGDNSNLWLIGSAAEPWIGKAPKSAKTSPALVCDRLIPVSTRK